MIGAFYRKGVQIVSYSLTCVGWHRVQRFGERFKFKPDTSEYGYLQKRLEQCLRLLKLSLEVIVYRLIR